jgi:chromosome segregation ATPase
VIGDFAQLAEEATKAWLGLGADPYKLSERATKEQLKRRLDNLKERVPDQEQNVIDATTKKAEKDLRLKEIDDEIASVGTTLTDRKRERAALVCPPKVQQCLLKQRQLDGEIQRLASRLENLTERVHPPAFERAAKAAVKLAEEEKALTAMTKAVTCLGAVVQLLTQVASIAELTIRILQGQRTGTVEFRTGT